MISRGARLAPKTLAGLGVPAIALALAAQGCLVPQSVDPESTRPHTIPRVALNNLPDYLLQPSLLLYPQGPNDVTPACHCVLDVKIPAIIADDPTVNVEARWFVDYDLNVPTSQRRVATVVLPGSFQTSETTRGPLEFTVDADGLGLSQGTHVIELVLAEQAGFAADTVFPFQRATKPDYESSTFKFVVQVRRDFDPARPTCDVGAQTPQIRSCSP
jgi:hypothetical protein